MGRRVAKLDDEKRQGAELLQEIDDVWLAAHFVEHIASTNSASRGRTQAGRNKGRKGAYAVEEMESLLLVIRDCEQAGKGALSNMSSPASRNPACSPARPRLRLAGDPRRAAPWQGW
jgi:hypothetical protein